jgi:alcohol dehydrogenase (cytochrome c)
LVVHLSDRGPKPGRIRHPRLIDGTDLNTGVKVWRTYTIPAPANRATRLKDGKALAAWRQLDLETATYDPETDTFYQGIAMPAPTTIRVPPRRQQMGRKRAALSPSDGKIKWGFQYPQRPV